LADFTPFGFIFGSRGPSNADPDPKHCRKYFSAEIKVKKGSLKTDILSFDVINLA
jgi:hypothetical protein